MWKQKSESVSSQPFVPTEPVRVPTPLQTADVRPNAIRARVDQATIAKGIVVRGDITGTDPLHVDGTVEGTIHIPGERVTIGHDGNVVAAKDHPGPCITAREIVIMGSVTGSIVASDRVDLRAHATLAGDVSTARVSIEDGAYFRGGIDIRRDDAPVAVQTPDIPQEIEPADPVHV
ncbi:MAG TPA: polymer-forming cytoskeletal protein [Terracidiphilus sp.]|jgi:cytoskeletal protein CcmA (bactofilin family)